MPKLFFDGRPEPQDSLLVNPLNHAGCPVVPSLNPGIVCHCPLQFSIRQENNFGKDLLQRNAGDKFIEKSTKILLPDEPFLPFTTGGLSYVERFRHTFQKVFARRIFKFGALLPIVGEASNRRNHGVRSRRLAVTPSTLFAHR